MALSTVITHATGDVFPAADWNTYIRDNVNFYTVSGADLASAATITPTSSFHMLTGTTTVDNITTTGAVAGQKLTLSCKTASGPIQIRHNGGGTGNIRLQEGLHATLVAGEIMTLAFDGTVWREVTRSSRLLTGQSIEMNATLSTGGLLPEDGSAISRTTYAALFAFLGTLFGAGDGSTTFNLPDSRGRVSVGHAASGGHADVSTVGANDGVAVANRRPKHRHTLHTHGMEGISSVGAGTNRFLQQTGPAGTLWEFTDQSDGGTNVASDSLDAPAYIVKPKYVRV